MSSSIVSNSIVSSLTVIRRSLPSDEPWALSLYRREFGAGHAWWSRWVEISNFLTQFRTQGWVAEGETGPVAFATVQVTTGRYGLMHGLVAGLPSGQVPWKSFLRGSWYLSGVAVEPEHRRKGTAQRLAQARITAARETGASSVFVSCLHGTGTEQMYTALGFTALERMASWTGDGQSAQLMFLALGPPQAAMEPAKATLWQRFTLMYLGRPWVLLGVCAGWVIVAWGIWAVLRAS